MDLAAEAARTAVAVLEWDGHSARVNSLRVGAIDADIVEAVMSAEKSGVDCPFGWPRRFVSMVTDHEAGRLLPPVSSGRGWRRGLALREADDVVHSRTGLTPLSVSADRIAHAAMRWAAIAATLASRGVDVRRDGSGPLAEVYPAAALKLWGLPFRGYKGAENVQARGSLVADLLNAAPWLELGPHGDVCRSSDDALDAVISALVARAVAQNATEPASNRSTAEAEGWIHLPTTPLETLAGTSAGGV